MEMGVEGRDAKGELSFLLKTFLPRSTTGSSSLSSKTTTGPKTSSFLPDSSTPISVTAPAPPKSIPLLLSSCSSSSSSNNPNPANPPSVSSNSNAIISLPFDLDATTTEFSASSFVAISANSSL